MSSLRILLLIPVAVTLFSQTEQNAVPNPGAAIANALRGAGKGSVGGLSRSILPSQLNQVSPLAAAVTPACAVPLQEMKIPDDKNFTVKELKPPQDFSDNMPTALPMPACAIAQNSRAPKGSNLGSRLESHP